MRLIIYNNSRSMVLLVIIDCFILRPMYLKKCIIIENICYQICIKKFVKNKIEVFSINDIY